jgi:hypothetical protein
MNEATPEAPGLTLRQFCEMADLDEEALALADEVPGVPHLVSMLVEREHFADAVRLLAHALPTREAIWWAWTAARRASVAEPPVAVSTALAVTERWISEPVEAHRRPGLEAAEHARLSTPAGCVAFAVYFSGGSIAPPDAPDVPAPRFASARAIAGAVILAAVVDEPEKAPEKFRASIDQGLSVARRIRLWPDADPSSS